jgi:hypothetical protein
MAPGDPLFLLGERDRVRVAEKPFLLEVTQRYEAQTQVSLHALSW